MTVMVEARAVRKSFGRATVLHDIDFTAAEGQVTCIIGPSGGGKSTLLRCVNHLEKIDGGTLRVDGELVGYRERGGALYEMKPREVAARRSRIGMVFQQFNLFPHLSVLDNLVHPQMKVRRESRRTAQDRAHALLARVGLGDRGAAYPRELSGGQQQRVAIARALAMQPRLMLFDEPTSALDPELVGEVLDVLRDLAASGMTMLVVTHEIGFAREVADQVLFMGDGQILESGGPSLLTNPENPRVRAFLDKVL